MNTVKDAAQALEAGLKTVSHRGALVAVHRDPGALLDPPALVLGPPSLQWEGVCQPPTSARFLVFAVVAFDEFAVERLWELAEAVGEAVDGYTDGTTVRADYAVYPSGATDLPAYEIQVDYPL